MSSRDKRDQEHFRSNYIEVVERNVPEFYGEKEYQLYGEEKDLSYLVLNSLLNATFQASSYLPLPDNFSAPSSFFKYFNPESKSTRVSPDDFSRFVLKPLGKSISGFRNRQEFEDFLLASALPLTQLNNVDATFAAGFSANVDPDKTTVALVEAELLNRLGWVYILNTSGTQAGLSYDLSTVLYSSLSDSIYFGKEYTELDGVKDIFEYLWRNREDAGFLTDKIDDFLPYPWNQPDSVLSTNVNTSGDLALSSLHTNLKVWISPDEDQASRFNDLLSDSLLGIVQSRRETAGPFSKFLRALSYGIYDVDVLTRDIKDLLDIEECPEEFLEYLANYLGWEFLTDNKDTWRSQLRGAIYAYKAKGTRNSIEYVVGLFVPSSLFSISDSASGLQELYESYLPNLLYYMLKTESPLREKQDIIPILNGWADKLFSLDQSYSSITLNYDPNNYDNTLRFLVDAILEYLHRKHNIITINRKDYRESDFWIAQEATGKTPGYFHRGKLCTIPPWEDSRFYQEASIRDEYLTDISALMVRKKEEFGMGISATVAEDFTNWVLSAIYPSGDPNLAPGFGSNNAFKFFTANPELPINHLAVIERGELDATTVFDYWNSKSSEVHIKMLANDIDFELDEVCR